MILNAVLDMPRVRRSYTVQRKLEIIRWHRENGGNYHETEREFGVSRKRLREWNQNYANLLAHEFGRDKFKRKLHEGGEPFSRLLDADVLEWLLEERAEGRVISNLSLREKAREIAARRPNAENFSASAGNEN